MPLDVSTVKQIFLAALEKAAGPERDGYVTEACAGDTALRRRVEAMLRAHAASGDFPDFRALAADAGSLTEDPKPSSEAATLPPGEAAAACGDSVFPFLAPPREVGRLGQLDHYEILSEIGQGGMGVVFKAQDESLDRIVAVKVLAPQYAVNATARRRFVREAKAIAAVVHEHVVTIHAVADEAPVPYLVMQYVQGVSLQDRLERTGPLELKAILRIGMQAARGLAAAHAQGIVHRDIKPANILLENGVERVKITDFGLARAVDDASITQSGVITGTPLYMSPEQANGEPVDLRSDLFSLGSVLYALCTGHPPFRADSTLTVLMRVASDTPRPIREVNPDMPDWLEAIIAKLHAKKREERFQTAKDVADLLEQHLAHLQEPHLSPRPAPVAITRAAEAPTSKVEKLLEATDVKRRIGQHLLLLAGFAVIIAVLGSFLTSDILARDPGTGNVIAVFLAVAAAFIAAAWVKQRWEVIYKGHRIRFQNSCYTGEALFLDGVCVARGGLGPLRELRAVIAHGEGAGDEIRAVAEADLTSVRCRIFAEQKTPPTGDSPALDEPAAPLPRSPWRRVAWIGLGFPLYFVFMMGILLPAYLDGTSGFPGVPRVWALLGSRYRYGGWWPTPWFEFLSAAAFLALAAWQRWRWTRLRWLRFVPALFGVWWLAFGFYVWPFGTCRYFGRLVSEGRYEEASQMLLPASGPWVYANQELTIQTRSGAVTLKPADLPLQSHDSVFRSFVSQRQNGSFRFTLTSQHHDGRRWVIGVTAYDGTVVYDSITDYLGSPVPHVVGPGNREHPAPGPAR
jgi:serine/threonine protein kinase